MTANWYRLTIVFVFCLLSACGGSSSNNSTPQASIKMGGAIQGKELSLSANVSTLAGASRGAEGTGTAARFVAPAGIATDGTFLFITDKDNTIRKVEIATGSVTTLAGSPGVYGSADGIGAAAAFNMPKGIVAVGANLYVVDSHNGTIRKIEIASGVVTTLAGNPRLHGGSFDGTGTAATFNDPTEITTDGTNLFVADNHRNKIRKVVIATAEVTTLATSTFYPGGGIAAAGSILYVADAPSIRKVDTGTGAISSLNINMGAILDIGTLPPAINPAGIISDGANIYFVDSYDHTIRQIEIASGVVTSLAGSAGATSAADGLGAAATFQNPTHITSDGVNLFVIDDQSIRKVVIASGVVTTLAGSTSATDDGTGTAARFRVPNDVATDGENLFVTDSGTIRKVALATGTVTTLAGTRGIYGSQDGTGAAASFGSPQYITTDGMNLFVSDNNNCTIRKIAIATGVVSTLSGSAGVIGSADGAGAAASFFRPSGITTDGINLFVSDGNNNTIRKIVIATGAVSTLAGRAGASGSTDGAGAAASFSSPRGITTDGTNLFVADYGNKTIRKIVIATGAVTTLAGSAGVYGSADGIGSAARFGYPTGISTDGTSLYLTDSASIRKIVIATGLVTTVAGHAGNGTSADFGFGAVDGSGVAARFYAPGGITTDGKNLFVADSTVIRKIQ